MSLFLHLAKTNQYMNCWQNNYITGNHKKYRDIDKITSNLPSNVTLTGFLSEEDYQDLLHSADVVIVITTQEYTLTCGAYEAVSLEKPMILGDTQTIREYFFSGALYTSSLPSDLAEKIEAAGNQLSSLRDGVVALKATLIETWNDQFKEVQKQIADIEGRHKKRAL
jgi:glycosyltransferase involved in cell wall biosynthesis